MGGETRRADFPRLARCGVLALAAAVLAACGFQPLYATGGTPRQWDPDLAAITVTPIKDRPGQVLELALREDLNPGGKSVPVKWRLDTVLTISRSDLGIQTNATATSSEINVIATFALVDIANGKPVYTSASRAVGDFNQLTDAYATQVASDDAQDRALRQVADEMALRMAVFVRHQRDAAASARDKAASSER